MCCTRRHYRTFQIPNDNGWRHFPLRYGMDSRTPEWQRALLFVVCCLLRVVVADLLFVEAGSRTVTIQQQCPLKEQLLHRCVVLFVCLRSFALIQSIHDAYFATTGTATRIVDHEAEQHNAASASNPRDATTTFRNVVVNQFSATITPPNIQTTTVAVIA